MVSESVKEILSEIRGAIDDKIKNIAEIIIKRLKNGEKKFLLTKNEIKQFYPYKNCPNFLNVSVEPIRSGIPSSYNYKTNTLRISPSISMFDDMYIVEILMHELTHFVNCFEKKNVYGGNVITTAETEKERTLQEILYLFNYSEMQARATQYKWALKNSWKGRDYEEVTRIERMNYLINEINNETYKEYEATFGVTDAFGTIVEGLLAERAYQQFQKYGIDRWQNFLSKDEFEHAKKAIINSLSKKYKKFKETIDKIYFDFLSEK